VTISVDEEKLIQNLRSLPFEHWTEVLGNERQTGAALDRLTHRCHIVKTTGESYRLQDAKRRRRPDR
jgi:DNA replication protein DnaC